MVEIAYSLAVSGLLSKHSVFHVKKTTLLHNFVQILGVFTVFGVKSTFILHFYLCFLLGEKGLGYGQRCRASVETNYLLATTTQVLWIWMYLDSKIVNIVNVNRLCVSETDKTTWSIILVSDIWNIFELKDKDFVCPSFLFFDVHYDPEPWIR